MNHNEAMQHGLAYAAGREDASGVPTCKSQARPDAPAFMAFADAYAQGWDEFNRQQRFMMTNCRSAYDRWQATNGGTIWDKHAPAARPLPESMAADTV